jgi:twitching motility protein PilT
MKLDKILQNAVEKKASDIFIIAGQPLSYKIDGHILPQTDKKILPEDSKTFIEEIYKLAKREMQSFLAAGDDDFSLTISGLSRFRVCTFKQRGSLAAVIRVIMFGLPSYQQLNIPQSIMDIAYISKGLVLFAGPAGSGKTTTLACIIDNINTHYNNHIITLEDPIEYLHSNKKSIISQREIHTDTTNYLSALRASLRQSPDVVLLGEMRDFETIQTAITASETGHLIISTLHTSNATNTIDRVIDVFPSSQQQQIRFQLSMVLKAVVCQQLIPAAGGGNIPVFEIMYVNNAIQNMIRESKTHQFNTVINSCASSGMCSMDNSLIDLAKKGMITNEDALRYSQNPEFVAKKI